MFPEVLRAKQNTAPEVYIDDPPDEPGAEMAREARVWKTYVRESDKSDKEMVDGRGNSLDVLLIFAALFSAISTAFVFASLGDLKPDPAESSAQTLLVMSQMLAAIANNQPVASPPADALDPPAFSPSQTAMVVNILWFLSLSLSVAVSLVAMLAKEWCYMFMSGRTGPSYEQARRRQRKWNGMERWRMKKALIYLPAVMHLALLLFAVGLCFYLWDVNKTVALPVIVITTLATLVYTCATILPAVDRFCPYSTPAVELFADVGTLLIPGVKWILKGVSQALVVFIGTIGKVLAGICLGIAVMAAAHIHMASIIVPSVIVKKLPGPAWLLPILAFIASVLLWGCWVIIGVLCLPPTAPVFFIIGLLNHLCDSVLLPTFVATGAAIHGVNAAIIALVNFDDKLDDLYGGDARVLMDTVTSQMIAWLIANCEDSRSVDTALQAIAGASRDLPHGPLVECEPHKLVLPRLDTCIKQGGTLPLAVRYCRAYGVLISGPTIRVSEDRWRRSWIMPTTPASDIHNHLMLCLDRASLAEQAGGSAVDHNLLASVVLATVPTCHWGWEYTLQGAQLKKVLKIITSLLQQQLQPGANLTSELMLYALVDSTSHYLIGLWPSEKESGSRGLLPILLAHTFLIYRNTVPEIAHSAAITLAATEFACRSYPGGDQPAPNAGNRETRALKVLRYYQAQKLDKNAAVALFIFGFFGLLPHLDLSDPETRLAAAASYLGGLMQQVPQFDFNRTAIRTLPDRYSLRDQIYVPALQTLTSVANSETSEDELSLVYACLPLLFHCLSESNFPDLYMLALMALCQAKSRQLQDLCINIVDRQPVPKYLTRRLDSEDKKALLERLCRTLLDTNTPILPIAVLHFELLIAGAALDDSYELQERQGALESLLVFRDRFPELKEPSPFRLESVSHSGDLSGDFTRNSMLHAMQCVVDFCGAGLNEASVPKDGLAALGRLKDSYKPGTAMIQRLGGAEPGSSSEPTRARATSSKANASGISGRYVDADGAVWVTEEQDAGSAELKLVLRGS